MEIEYFICVPHEENPSGLEFYSPIHSLFVVSPAVPTRLLPESVNGNGHLGHMDQSRKVMGLLVTLLARQTPRP